jgi:carbonic anhydrase/acetyltransferase-like protein (isoleucine patch superfamily)
MTGHGNRYLAQVLGSAAAFAGHTGTFLEERSQRIAAAPGSPAPALLQTPELPRPGQLTGILLGGRLPGSRGPFRDRYPPRTETTAMNPTDATVAELATAPSASMAKVSLSSAQVRSGHIEIRHRGFAPSVHPDAYVAPTAVLSGQVSIGPGSCVLHGAVLAAEGGPVQVGAGCVIMENAVLRGTVPHPLRIGDRVLAGPHAQLTGCTITDEVFIAAGAMVGNGAHLGRAASVALGAIVHLGAIVEPHARIPAGWVAVGDPAHSYPPGEAGAIEAGLAETGWSFLPFIFGVDDAGGRRDQLRTALARYTAAMASHHRQDQIITAPKPVDASAQATKATGRAGHRIR